MAEWRSGREAVARAVGVTVALTAMTVAWSAIRWPAPAVSIGLGFGAYLLVRPSGRGEP